MPETKDTSSSLNSQIYANLYFCLVTISDTQIKNLFEEFKIINFVNNVNTIIEHIAET